MQRIIIAWSRAAWSGASCGSGNAGSPGAEVAGDPSNLWGLKRVPNSALPVLVRPGDDAHDIGDPVKAARELRHLVGFQVSIFLLSNEQQRVDVADDRLHVDLGAGLDA